MYCWAKPHPSMLLNWYALFHLMWLLILVVQDKCVTEVSGTNKIFAQWDFVNFGCTWKNSNWTSPQGFRNVPVADSTVYRENVAEYGFGQVRWNLRFFFFFFWQLLKSFKRKSFKSRIYLFLNPLKERDSSVTHFHQGHWNQRLPWPHNFPGHPPLDVINW